MSLALPRARFREESLAPRIADHIVVKLASRCNLACSYCHWFRDESVFLQPKLLEPEVENHLLDKIQLHLARHRTKLKIILHGGEPLLFGKKRMAHFCRELRRIEARTRVPIDIGITTNGVLLDCEWCGLLREFGVVPCVSIDGPAEVHDAKRLDVVGRGSHKRAVDGLNLLRSSGFADTSVLSVCSAGVDPARICEYIVEDLGVRSFDVLIPNHNYDDRELGNVQSISAFYINLFDLWYCKYSQRGVSIRVIESFVAALLGRRGQMAGIGFGSLATVSVRPDGGLEPHDVLRIGGADQTETGLNVRTHAFDDVVATRAWAEAWKASVMLPSDCRACRYKDVCHGGYVIHRYSSRSGYSLPSVYCNDLLEIYDHILRHLAQDLFVATPLVSGETETTAL